MTPADSPENKCPGGDACPYCSPQVPNRVCVELAEAEADWLAASIAPESEVSATAQGIYDKINLAIGAAPSPEATASPSAAPTNSGAGSRSDSEGEGLAARVERLAERMTGLARKQADEFGNYVSQGQFSADYKEGLASAYDDSAEALRSLLVPKEEA